MCVRLCVAASGLSVIKGIHQIMTAVPGSIASWDPERDQVNMTTAIKHTDDGSQQDSSCFLRRCDSLTNYVWCVGCTVTQNIKGGNVITFLTVTVCASPVCWYMLSIFFLYPSALLRMHVSEVHEAPRTTVIVQKILTSAALTLMLRFALRSFVTFSQGWLLCRENIKTQTENPPEMSFWIIIIQFLRTTRIWFGFFWNQTTWRKRWDSCWFETDLWKCWEEMFCGNGGGFQWVREKKEQVRRLTQTVNDRTLQICDLLSLCVITISSLLEPVHKDHMAVWVYFCFLFSPCVVIHWRVWIVLSVTLTSVT